MRVKSKMKIFHVQLKYFSGAKVADVSDKLGDFIEQKPDCIILHVGTNNSPNMSYEKIDEILTVKHRIEKEAPETKVVISAPIVRTDNGKAALTIRNIIKHLQQLDIEIINNENINHKDCLLYTSPSPRDKRQSRMPSSA